MLTDYLTLCAAWGGLYTCVRGLVCIANRVDGEPLWGKRS